MPNYEGNRYELRRETSQYNKYMKWHVLYFNAEGFIYVVKSVNLASQFTLGDLMGNTILWPNASDPYGTLLGRGDYEVKNALSNGRN
jgi:hypothetical protein